MMENGNVKVRLRAMEPEDLELLYQIENNEEAWNVGVSNVPYSKYVLRDYIASSRNDIYEDGQVRLLIDNADGITVGVLDLVNFDPRSQRAELGIIILKAHRGKGYGQAAIAKILDHSRKVLHLRQVYAYIDADNKDSIRCLASVGFRETAQLKDWFFVQGEFKDAVVMQFFL